jgi:hypothetical protein
MCNILYACNQSVIELLTGSLQADTDASTAVDTLITCASTRQPLSLLLLLLAIKEWVVCVPL